MGWDSLPFWSLSLNFGTDFAPFVLIPLNSKQGFHQGGGRRKRGCWYSQKRVVPWGIHTLGNSTVCSGCLFLLLLCSGYDLTFMILVLWSYIYDLRALTLSPVCFPSPQPAPWTPGVSLRRHRPLQGWIPNQCWLRGHWKNTSGFITDIWHEEGFVFFYINELINIHNKNISSRQYTEKQMNVPGPEAWKILRSFPVLWYLPCPGL